jgi:hypothetical protein
LLPQVEVLPGATLVVGQISNGRMIGADALLVLGGIGVLVVLGTELGLGMGRIIGIRLANRLENPSE